VNYPNYISVGYGSEVIIGNCISAHVGGVPCPEKVLVTCANASKHVYVLG